MQKNTNLRINPFELINLQKIELYHKTTNTSKWIILTVTLKTIKSF
jgi:hypothetical protein